MGIVNNKKNDKSIYIIHNLVHQDMSRRFLFQQMLSNYAQAYQPTTGLQTFALVECRHCFRFIVRCLAFSGGTTIALVSNYQKKIKMINDGILLILLISTRSGPNCAIADLLLTLVFRLPHYLLLTCFFDYIQFSNSIPLSLYL